MKKFEILSNNIKMFSQWSVMNQYWVDNDLLPISRKAIIWTIDGLSYWRIHMYA